MFHKSKKNISRILVKYLASYLLVFILPLIIGMLFLYNHSLSLITGFIEEQNTITLERVTAAITGQVAELHEIPVQLLATENLFRPFYIKSSQYNVVEMMRELQKYNTTNQFISDIGFYIRGDSVLYLSSSTCDIGTFMTSRYRFSDYGQADLSDALNGSAKPLFWPASPASVMGGPVQNVLLYFYPLVPGSLYPYATLLYIINEDDLINSVSNSKYDPAIQNIIITGADGQVLCSSGDSKYFSVSDFTQIRASFGEAGEAGMATPDYSITHLHSPALEWDFYLVTPRGVIMERTQVLKQTLLVIGAASLVLGLLLVILMSYYSYRPIRFLGEKTRRLIPSAQRTDEISLISEGIERLSLEKSRLTSKILQNRDAVRHYVLTRYLYGQADYIPSLDEMAADAGIILDHDGYCAALYRIASYGEAIDYKEITRALENAMGESLEAYAAADVQNRQILVLLAFDRRAEAASGARDALERTRQLLLDRYGLRGSWGIGRRCDTKGGIGRSLVEASAALDHSLLTGDPGVACADDFGEASVHPMDLSLPIQRLELALYQNNAEALDKTIDEIFAALKDSQLPPFLIRCYCYDVLNSILGVNRIIRPDEKENLKALDSILTPGPLGNTGDMAGVIREAARRIMAGKNQNPHAATLIEQIIGYTQDHCFDWNFSVHILADEFDMTVSNISHFFKAKTGCTITNFVNRLRLEKACELLSGTDLSVKEICANIGYIDASSFIRSFKSKYNLTPGHYRSLSQQ